MTISKPLHIYSKITHPYNMTNSEMWPISSPKTSVKPYIAFGPPLLTRRISEQSDVNGAPQAIIESPLLRLPPELRNIIFAYALDHGTVSPHLGTTSLERRLRKDPIRKRFGLLFTCRQIYAETALLPYKLNTFSVRGLLPLVALENFLCRRTQAQMQVMDKVQMYHEEVRAATVWMEKIASCELEPAWYAT